MNNAVVRNGFVDALAAGYFKEPGLTHTNWLMEVSDALEEGDIDTFIKKMTSLLGAATYRFCHKYDPIDCERYFHYTFYLILQMIGKYNTMVEKETSEGRIDCVIECPEHVYIIEFKLDGSADAALKQIEDKGYAKPYAADKRPVHLIGINFSSEKGNIADVRMALYIVFHRFLSLQLKNEKTMEWDGLTRRTDIWSAVYSMPRPRRVLH